MSERVSRPESEPRKAGGVPKKIKTLIFLLELTLIILLLVLWFTSKDIKQSRNLWVLFFYSFPAEFLIAIVPHEPVMLFFAKFTSPLIVTAITIAGIILTEILNYTFFNYLTDTNLYRKLRQRKSVSKLVNLFNKAPFVALWVAGFTPIPFYPFRFLVVMARYPIWKYLLAVFLSRTPRVYLISIFGSQVHIPNSLLVALFVVLIAAANIPLLRGVLRKKKDEDGGRDESEAGLSAAPLDIPGPPSAGLD